MEITSDNSELEFRETGILMLSMLLDVTVLVLAVLL